MVGDDSCQSTTIDWAHPSIGVPLGYTNRPVFREESNAIEALGPWTDNTRKKTASYFRPAKLGIHWTRLRGNPETPQ